MEKRFAAFIFRSIVVLIGYQAVDSRLNPRPPADEVAQNPDILVVNPALKDSWDIHQAETTNE